MTETASRSITPNAGDGKLCSKTAEKASRSVGFARVVVLRGLHPTGTGEKMLGKSPFVAINSKEAIQMGNVG